VVEDGQKEAAFAQSLGRPVPGGQGPLIGFAQKFFGRKVQADVGGGQAVGRGQGLRVVRPQGLQAGPQGIFHMRPGLGRPAQDKEGQGEAHFVPGPVQGRGLGLGFTVQGQEIQFQGPDGVAQTEVGGGLEGRQVGVVRADGGGLAEKPVRLGRVFVQ